MSQPTLSAWEGERKNPSVDSLIRMSELYGVSVDYLLGLPAERYHRADLLQPIPVEIIPIFHETPVFSIDRGWAMVDAIEGVLHFADGATQPLAKLVDTCYVLPPAHVIPGMVTEKPLYRDELMDHDTYARASAIILYDFCQSLHIPITVYSALVSRGTATRLLKIGRKMQWTSLL